MEDNIKEIAKRIRHRRHELLTHVQRQFRGYVTRRLVKYYRLETIRLLCWRIANALRIQCVYRGHRIRIQLPKFISELIRSRRMFSYQQDQILVFRKKKNSRSSVIVKAAYVKERAEEITARLTSRIESSSHFGLKKMKAFAASCYAGDDLPQEMTKLLSLEIESVKEKNASIIAERDRKAFINKRIAEHGPQGFGYRGYTPDDILAVKDGEAGIFLKKAGGEKLVNGNIDSFIGHKDRSLNSEYSSGILEKKLESSRSTKMRSLFSEELNDLVGKAIDRAVHDFKKIGLIDRLRSHNKSKLTSGLLNFKYPKNINDKPLEWLNDDMEVTIRHLDKVNNSNREKESNAFSKKLDKFG